MRFIYYIIAIVVLLSTFTLYQWISSRPSQEKAALIINDRVISIDEFDKLYRSAPLNMKSDRNEFLDHIITKELLIQEAKHEGIDKDESFRMSMQNFYEQSLIKILMDRKYKYPEVTVTDDEVAKYTSFLNKKLSVTISSFDSIEEAKKGTTKQTEQKRLGFESLSDNLKYVVLGLKESEGSRPIKQGKTYITLRIDRVEEIPGSKPEVLPQDKIRDLLVEVKRNMLIEDSIAKQREKAVIKVLLDIKK